MNSLLVGAVALIDADGLPRLASHASAGDPEPGQLGLFGAPPPPARPEEREVLDALRELDPNTTTPLTALAMLHELVGRLKSGNAP